MAANPTSLDLFGADNPDALSQHLTSLNESEQDDIVNTLPAKLQSLISLFEHELTKAGYLHAHSVAQQLVMAQAHYFGGMQIYLPRNDRLKRCLRDIQIYREYKGNNVRQLARRYRLTEITIYAILRDQTAAEKARRQLDLF